MERLSVLWISLSLGSLFRIRLDGNSIVHLIVKDTCSSVNKQLKSCSKLKIFAKNRSAINPAISVEIYHVYHLNLLAEKYCCKMN